MRDEENSLAPSLGYFSHDMSNATIVETQTPHG